MDTNKDTNTAIHTTMNTNIYTDSAEAEIEQIISNSLANHSLEAVQIETPQLAQVHQETNNTIATDNTNDDALEDSASIEVFNTALHQYLRINEEIKSLMQAVKNRNEIKRKLSDTLSNYLKAKQIKKVNLDGSYKGKRLEVEVKTTNTGFSKAAVTEALLNELQEENELFDKIMRAISKTSVLKEVWKLKVIEEKKHGAGGSVKKGKGRQMGSSMADAAALIEDE